MDKYKILHDQSLYDPNLPEIMGDQAKCLEKLYDFNNTRPLEQEKRQTLLKEMFAEFGQGCYIEPPLRANWAGKHVHFGNYVYANFNLTLVDDTHIYVGDYTLIGPNVTIITGNHPIYPSLRQKALQFNESVKIGKNCWIGAGSIILPNVTIGDNVIVGAGSVVNKDLPSNTICVGVPCKVLRGIEEKDKIYYSKTRKIPEEFFKDIK